MAPCLSNSAMSVKTLVNLLLLLTLAAMTTQCRSRESRRLRSVVNNQPCQELSSEDLLTYQREKYAKMHKNERNHVSYQLLNGAGSANVRPFNYTWHDIERYQYMVCPNRSMRAGSVRKRSNCPYGYRLHVDNQRYPQTIVQAVCECSRCIAARGDGLTVNGCVPVVVPTRVLIRTENECDRWRGRSVQKWKRMVLEVSAGCTCVKIGQNFM